MKINQRSRTFSIPDTEAKFFCGKTGDGDFSFLLSTGHRTIRILKNLLPKLRKYFEHRYLALRKNTQRNL